MPSFRTIVMLMLAGAAGTVARYGLVLLVSRAVSSRLPIGTFVVNVAGCFLFGLIWSLAAERGKLSEETRIVVLVGFMGAFTTFSSFVFESVHLWREGIPWAAIGYVVASNVVGIGVMLLGMQLAKLL